MNYSDTKEGKAYSAMREVYALFSKSVKVDPDNPDHAYLVSNLLEEGHNPLESWTTEIINFDNTQDLQMKFEERYSEWCEQMKKADMEQFVQRERLMIERLQADLPDYLDDAQQNRYHTMLTKWGEYLNKGNTQVKTFNPLSLIQEHCYNLIAEHESKLETEIEQWKQDKDKTGCAAYCVYLKEKKYFKPNTFVAVAKYAKSKWNIDVSNVINDRNKATEKERFTKRLNEIERKLIGKMYGKV